MEVTNVLLALLAIMQLVIMAVIVPSGQWMFRANARLAKIEAMLSKEAERKDDSQRVHDELFSRVRRVELDIAKCHVCQGAIPEQPAGG